MQTATAIASPNIAFIKYWGDIDPSLRLAANSSLSMNLDGLFTRTSVSFDPALSHDELVLNNESASAPALERVSTFLDRVRGLAGIPTFASVRSSNNFPMGTGIASSASAFAALALAASSAAGLSLPEKDLSRLARVGSGSACRSIPAGFVEWQAGPDDNSSYAYSIAPPEHWDLVDCIAIVDRRHKPVGSKEGHGLAGTSPLQAARIADTPPRLSACRRAILEKDFDLLAQVVESDSNLMHAVMMTSTPSLLYWQPATVLIMQSVRQWRSGGLPACFTVDAGPNVHVICPSAEAAAVESRLLELPGVMHVLSAHPGVGAHLLDISNID